MNNRRGVDVKWIVLLALVGASVFLVSWLASGDSTPPTVQEDSAAAATATSESVAATTVPPTTAAAPTVTSAVAPSALGRLTIGQEIDGAEDLTTIDEFLTAGDLDDMLEGPGQYTVFAPSNIRFAEMDKDLLNVISADQDRVRTLARIHVVEGDVPSLRGLDEPLVTLAGTELILEEIDDELFIVTAAGRVGVQENRIIAVNGILHGVDAVLLGDESSGVAPLPSDDEPESPTEEEPPVEEPVDEDPPEEADPAPEPEDPPSAPNETVDAIAELLELEPVQFDDSSADIKADSLATLDRVVELLEEDDETRLEVAGHTDDIGPADGNQRWSERRARSVRDYLISQGVDPDRLVAVGYGEGRPIADNATAEGRAQNRRIEFTQL